jgi:hypothetical protein
VGGGGGGGWGGGGGGQREGQSVGRVCKARLAVVARHSIQWCMEGTLDNPQFSGDVSRTDSYAASCCAGPTTATATHLQPGWARPTPGS